MGPAPRQAPWPPERPRSRVPQPARPCQARLAPPRPARPRLVRLDRRGLVRLNQEHTGLAAGLVPDQPDQQAHPDQADQRGDGLVEPDRAEGVVGKVQPDALGEEPAEPVERHVESEHLAAAQPEPAICPEQGHGDQQVPDRLVGEGWMERRVLLIARDPMRRVDLETPWQVGGQAVELLVEPVAEPAQSLTHGDTGGERVGQRREPDAATPAHEPGAQSSEADGAVDGDTALPDPQRTPRVDALAEVVAQVGQHVVDAGADDADRDRHQHDRLELLGSTSPGLPAPVADHPGGDDAGDQAQRVDVQKEGTQLPAVDRRGRNGQNHPTILPHPPSDPAPVRSRRPSG